MPFQPAPWTLHGSGLVLVCKFSARMVEASGLLPGELQGRAHGGIGGYGLIDYRRSNAGSYRELLVLPGRFLTGGKPQYSISQIYVDSDDSLTGGRLNWGIPKQLAALRVSRPGETPWRFEAELDGQPLFQLEARPLGPALPLRLGRLPFALFQDYEGVRYKTRFGGRFKMRFARVTHVFADGSRFPDPAQFRILFAVMIEDFTLHFPPADRQPLQ
ncbi:acetoacetate decarboxylase family protein [Paenibacillus sp. CN-4]|uniref:acetoacetate decarboxylase family protein n=1 Tax=Paenibacillus nanchangensis TaxID=3348343 RepID=UPI00397BCF63